MGLRNSKPKSKKPLKTKNLGPFDSVASERRSLAGAVQRGVVKAPSSPPVAPARPRTLRQRSAPLMRGGRRRKRATRKHRRRRKRATRKHRRRRKRATRKHRRRRRGGGTYDETPVSDGEHKIIMQENYEKLLRYYGTYAKGHSRDPFGSNATKAKGDILKTLKKYQCKIPELQASLLKKYGAAPKLTDDLRHPEARRRYNCGQEGGRRSRRH